MGSRWRVGKAPNQTVPGQVLNGLFPTPVEGHSGLSCLWPGLPTRHQIPGDERHRGQPLSQCGILTLCPQRVLTLRCPRAARGCEGRCRSQSSITALGRGGHDHCVPRQLLVQQGTGEYTHSGLPWRTRAGHRPLTLCQSVSLHLSSQGAGVLSVPQKTRVDGEILEEASQEG